MNRLYPMFLTPALLCLGAATHALSAAPVLDQQYQPFGSNALIVSVDQFLGQTFTVNKTGVLSSVEVEVARNTRLPGSDLFFELRSTDSTGAVSSSALFSATIAEADVSISFSFLSVDLSSANLAVTKGDVLAIILKSNAPDLLGGIDPYGWRGNGPGFYARGTGLVGLPASGPDFSPAPYDFGFRAYVVPAVSTVPEPSTALLLFAGMGAGAVWHRRRLTARS